MLKSAIAICVMILPKGANWALGIGQWAMGNGQWAMGNGQWAMGIKEAQDSDARSNTILPMPHAQSRF